MFILKKIVNNAIRFLFEIYNSIFSFKYKEITLKERLSFYSNKLPFYKGKGNQLENFSFTDKDIIQNALSEFPKKGLFTNGCK